MKILRKQQRELYENAKVCCKERFEKKYLKDKKHHNAKYHYHYTGEYKGAAHTTCSLKYSVPKKLLQFFIMDLTMIKILS